MGMLDNLKNLRDLVMKVGGMEATKQLIDVQQDMMELLDENRRLKEENAALKERRRLGELLKFRGDVYWLEEPGKPPDGPFCSACWDARTTLVRMHTVENGTTGPFYSCPLTTCTATADKGPRHPPYSDGIGVVG
jgi:hypothetical protein